MFVVTAPLTVHISRRVFALLMVHSATGVFSVSGIPDNPRVRMIVPAISDQIATEIFLATLGELTLRVDVGAMTVDGFVPHPRTWLA